MQFCIYQIIITIILITKPGSATGSRRFIDLPSLAQCTGLFMMATLVKLCHEDKNVIVNIVTDLYSIVAERLPIRRPQQRLWLSDGGTNSSEQNDPDRVYKRRVFFSESANNFQSPQNYNNLLGLLPKPTHTERQTQVRVLKKICTTADFGCKATWELLCQEHPGADVL